jgi:hypothetical protein
VDAALVRADQRVTDDIRRVVVQSDVVERKLQRLAGALDEGRDPPRDVQRRLAAVGEGVNLDQAPQDTYEWLRGRRLRLSPPVLSVERPRGRNACGRAGPTSTSSISFIGTWNPPRATAGGRPRKGSGKTASSRLDLRPCQEARRRLRVR